MKLRPVTVKIPAELHQMARDVCTLTGVRFRDLFVEAIRKEIALRLSTSKPALRMALESMRAMRTESEDTKS